MAKRKPPRRKSQQGSPPKSGLSLRRTADQAGWLLVHPRCVRERAEDLDEVHQMIEAGEAEVAVDELRWLLSGCSEFIEAHLLSGELALAAGDVPLARGHFGFGYQLGVQTLQRAGIEGPLPYRQPANQPFFQAGRGLVVCLERLGKGQMAEEVAHKLVRLDPSDPLHIGGLLDELRTAGKPIVDLGGPGDAGKKQSAD